MENVLINKLELASELTELFIEIKYEEQNVPLYNIKDEDDEMRYTDKIQDEFNQMYDEYLQLIDSLIIKQ
jgi:hypothetical protein